MWQSLGAQGNAATATIRARAVPTVDHSLVVQNIWVVVAISLGCGGFIGEIAGFLHGDLGMGAKLLIGAGGALIIFGSIWFFAPATAA